MKDDFRMPASFRDPSGFLFHRNGGLYRQVNRIYKEHYDHLTGSGLYSALVDARLLIPHEQSDIEPASPAESYKILKPEIVPVISYPYEWCFSQLKHAALATLMAQKTALKHGMILKDASAYNIQFRQGRPVLIDSLSFEIYREGQPWIGYRQFCQHFLAPLALMAKKDVRLNQLLRNFIDGIPLDLASSLLPWSSNLSFSVFSHIHLHAKSQRHFADKKVDLKSYKVSKRAMDGLIDNLQSSIRKFKWKPEKTEWADYYHDTNYSDAGFQQKKELISEMLDQIGVRRVLDLGANTGVFSRIASEKGIVTISVDGDPAAVEQNYIYCSQTGETNLLPLLIDLTNPSPGIGWNNEERVSWIDRCRADCVFALALIHHLAISNHVHFRQLAELFKKLGRFLIIEFVPKSDSQVQRLLTSREDVFAGYNREEFESEFRKCFNIILQYPVVQSERILYLMQAIL